MDGTTAHPRRPERTGLATDHGRPPAAGPVGVSPVEVSPIEVSPIEVSPIEVSVVGSTGSIGTQALDVVASSPELFRVVALAARRSVEALATQAKTFRPEVVAVADADMGRALERAVPRGTEVLAGPEGLCEVARRGRVVLNAAVGFAGLPVTLAALGSGRRLALANKESLIAGAPVVQRARRTPGAEIVPVDSEHCALHQCLRAGGGADEVGRLVLTASGGPFRGRRPDELEAVGVDEALAHPTWRMGPKVTIDSSTLMNKGLEVIEAHELFGVGYDRIAVVIHPQSVVHSMVEFTDGATVAQLSLPDMRLPIGYALGYPRRLGRAFGAVDWSRLGRLDFELPDRAVFRCLGLAEAAGRAGGLVPAWLNAGNEVAVAAFVEGRITWGAIAAVVADTVEAFDSPPATSAEDVVEADRRAREQAEAAVRRRGRAA
jgi:1-deoxy-D-xylulose-5-phosphate reductoisomerase